MFTEPHKHAVKSAFIYVFHLFVFNLVQLKVLSALLTTAYSARGAPYRTFTAPVRVVCCARSYCCPVYSLAPFMVGRHNFGFRSRILRDLSDSQCELKLSAFMATLEATSG